MFAKRRSRSFPGEQTTQCSKFPPGQLSSSIQRWIRLTSLFLVPGLRSVCIVLSTMGFTGEDPRRFQMGFSWFWERRRLRAPNSTFWFGLSSSLRFRFGSGWEGLTKADGPCGCLDLSQRSCCELKDCRIYFLIRSDIFWRGKLKELLLNLRLLIEPLFVL